LNERLEEILHITQEECAEVTQAISKIFRFGFSGIHKGKTNKEHLEEEVGDLVAMIRLLYAEGAIDESAVERACIAKLVKLNKWSKHIKFDLEEIV
jgi:NTP pyrophosphatase (non-canonical NTP hydrolase)